jgi:hypothetical protein
MTELTQDSAGGAWEGNSGGVDWHVELDRSILLPGRLATGRLLLRAERGIEARGVVVGLIAEEHWRHRVTTHGANGTSSTRVVTSREEVLREPVRVHGPLHLAAGEAWTASFEQPVPGMGPATLIADDAGLEWSFEAKLDIPGGLDSSIEHAVVVAQPTALLRAGAVHVGEFALYEQADSAADGVTGTIKLEPMPLVCGAPFTGRLELAIPGSVNVQEIRAELRVKIEATVSQGEEETVTAWSGQLAPAGAYQGSIGLDVAGALDPRPLPTIELPHGRAQATFHVILARAWALDTHLARDVTIATTSEL